MANVKFTQQPQQRFPGDRKWKNEDAPKTDNKKAKGSRADGIIRADGALFQRQCRCQVRYGERYLLVCQFGYPLRSAPNRQTSNLYCLPAVRLFQAPALRLTFASAAAIMDGLSGKIRMARHWMKSIGNS